LAFFPFEVLFLPSPVPTSPAEAQMLNELQTWWQNTTPEMQAAVQTGGLVLAALVGGHFLGAIVARVLRARNFDEALRVPGSSRPSPEAGRGITPTWVAGMVVRLTVWAVAAWWLARAHGRVELANTLGLAIQRTWALASVLVAALWLGSLLAHRLIDCLPGVSKTGSEGLASRNGAAAPRWNAAGAVGAGAYVLAVLLVLLIAADLFDWPLTHTSALALWQFTQHLLIAGAALFIGCLGAGWARDVVTPESTVSPEKRAGQYTALGIVAATTILAVAVLLSSAGVLIGLAALAVLGLLVWLGRDYLPDVTAGLQLRAHKVREVSFDEETWQLADVGILTTQVCRGGEVHRVANRRVLEASFHGMPTEANVRR
jgi:hypothetical protein